MAKKTIKLNNEEGVYPYLQVNKTLRSSFYIIMATVFVLIGSSIFSGIINEHHWTIMAISSCLIGLILMVYPETETWVYKPWQSQANKIEHHEN